MLTVDGVLDRRRYLQLRNRIIEAALGEPRAVLVDVNALRVPASSLWKVFTSARWYVSIWPDVPIILICAHAGRQRIIARSGVTRAARHEDPHLGGDRVSGLAIVASVCRAWGSTPMSSGKTVWAVLGPENQL